jgi:hypothetical protein
VLVAVVGLIEVHSDGGSELLVGNATSLYTLDLLLYFDPLYDIEEYVISNPFLSRVIYMNLNQVRLSQLH